MEDDAESGAEVVSTVTSEPAAPPTEEKPIADAEAKSKTGSKKSAGLPEKYPHLGQAKILVVEDAKPIRMMLQKTISRVSRLVDEAEHGKIALVALTEAAERGHPYDLVFLDLMMPVMDGILALRHIRATEALKETPVIIVTAKNSREDVVGCAKLGVAGYLLKPFKTQGVLEIAEKTLADVSAAATSE